MMNIPMPPEAKKALGRIDEMADNLKAIRELLERQEQRQLAEAEPAVLPRSQTVEPFHIVTRNKKSS